MSNTDGFIPNPGQGGGSANNRQSPTPQRQNNASIWGWMNRQNSGDPPPNNDPQNKDNNKDNIDPKIKMVDDIWNEPAPDPNKKNDQPTPPNNQGDLPDPKAQLKRHLEDVGLGDLALTEQEIEAFKSGDNIPDVLGKINARIQNGYLKAMSGLTTVMDKKIENAVKAAVGQSQSMFQGERIRDYLQTNFTQAKDPVMGPVAETVMKRLLDKGSTQAEALDGVKEFFKRIDLSMNPEKGKVNPNMRSGFGGNTPPGDKQGLPAGENNWLDVLTGNADRRS